MKFARVMLKRITHLYKKTFTQLFPYYIIY